MTTSEKFDLRNCFPILTSTYRYPVLHACSDQVSPVEDLLICENLLTWALHFFPGIAILGAIRGILLCGGFHVVDFFSSGIHPGVTSL
jgi:hypothetical protein